MKRLLNSIAILVLVSFVDVSGQRIEHSDLHEMIRQSIDLAGRQIYSEAQSILDDAIKAFPQHPAPYLHKAILLEVISLDFETPLPQKEYYDLLEKVITIAERTMARDESAPEARYYLGMAHSYIAYEKYREGQNWLSGLTHGYKAYGYLKECIDLDPEAYDAMTGVGTFKYWKSKKTQFLSWLPFVGDDRFAGINLLKMAEVKGNYTCAQATNSLVWIYIEEERYNDAIKAAQSVLRRYPNHRLFLWGLATAAERKQDWATARDAYMHILTTLNEEVTERRYIEIQARAKVARMSWYLKDYELAERECQWVLANSKINLDQFTSDGASRILRRVEDMELLRKQLRKLNSNSVTKPAKH